MGLKIELRNKPLKNGEHPVIIRIRHDYKTKVITLFSVHPTEWNPKTNKVRHSHSRCDEMNRLLREKATSLEDRIFELNRKGGSYSIDDILNYNESGKLSEEIQRYMDELGDLGKSNRKIKNLKDHILSFGDVSLDNVDILYLKKFTNYLRGQKRIKSEYTVSKYISNFQGVLNRCKIDIDFHVKKPIVLKAKLNPDEIDALKGIELTGMEGMARDAWLCCFYSGGSRISEVLRMQNPVDSKVLILQSKGEKPKVIVIGEELEAIFSKYDNKIYALPFLTLPLDADSEALRKQIESCTTMINLKLKIVALKAGINKKITTHVARHSFAFLADQKGLSTTDIQSLLDHSSARTTDTYLRELRSVERKQELRDRVYGKD